MTNDKSHDRLDDIISILGKIYNASVTGNVYNQDKSPKISVIKIEKAFEEAEKIGKRAVDEILFATKNRASYSKKEPANDEPDEKKEETVEPIINTDEEAVRLLKKIENFMDDDEDFRDGEEYLWLVDRYTLLGNKDVRVKDTDK